MRGVVKRRVVGVSHRFPTCSGGGENDVVEVGNDRGAGT
jgi:hypothetical protein